MVDLLRKGAPAAKIVDQSADGGNAWTLKIIGRAEGQQFRIQLVLAQIGMDIRASDALDFFYYLRRPEAAALNLGRAALFIQSFQLAVAL